MYRWLFTTYLAILLFGCIAIKKNQMDRMVFIENDKVKVGILCDVGGRVVFFGKKENMLYSDEKFWNEPSSERMVPSVETSFKGYNGFITWVGPQSDWWVQQTLNPEKARKKEIWPPDPYLIYGDYHIIEKTDHKLVIEGEGSPVTGLKFKKSYVLQGSKLHIHVSAKNIRETPVQWDLWSNIRFPAHTPFFVPAQKHHIKKIDSEMNTTSDTMKYIIEDGFFSFIPSLPEHDKKVRWGKAYLNPDKGQMAVFDHQQLMLMTFKKVASEKIHPNQAFVEVFNRVGVDSTQNLLELEHHSAYEKILPGQSIELEETWELFNTRELSNREERINFYNKIVNQQLVQ